MNDGASETKSTVIYRNDNACIASGKSNSDESKKIIHASGAASSHKTPNYFFIPGVDGARATAERFEYGNTKYEHSSMVYADANWLKAYYARDVAFFRDRAGHALEHLYAEMRGSDDSAPGGNLGALGWFQAVMAFVREHDPHFYGAIQGKWKLEVESTKLQQWSEDNEKYNESVRAQRADFSRLSRTDK